MLCATCGSSRRTLPPRWIRTPVSDPRTPGLREGVGREQLDKAAAIPKICLGEEADRHSMSRPADDLDPVTGPDLTLLDDSQVGSGPTRHREALQEPGISHADAELEAREAWLGDLEQRRAHPPALAQLGRVEVDPRYGQVLAERSGVKHPGAELGAPPSVVLARIGVYRLVDSAMDGAIGLVVAIEVHAPNRHPAGYGMFPDRGRHRPALMHHRSRHPDVHRDNLEQRHLVARRGVVVNRRDAAQWESPLPRLTSVARNIR